MGIFSDEDINEVDGLIKNENYRIRFLKGFEEGYNNVRAKQVPFDRYQFVNAVQIAKDLFRIPLDKYPNVEVFGSYIGLFMAILKFRPKYMVAQNVGDAGMFVDAVKSLETKNPKLYELIAKRIKRWNKVMKGKIKELKPEELQTYAYLIKFL